MPEMCDPPCLQTDCKTQKTNCKTLIEPEGVGVICPQARFSLRCAETVSTRKMKLPTF